MRTTLIMAASLACFSLLASRADAQTGGARGKVVDAEGRGLPDVTVTLESLAGGAGFELLTNKNGEYIQLGLSTGPYQITARKEGYEPRSVQARIGIGMATDIDKIELDAARPAAPDRGSVEKAVHESFARGVELAQAGQLDEAVAAFEEILESYPGIVEVHRNLGSLHARQKDWARAEASFLAALDLQPGNPDYLAALVQIYQESGQEEKAREWITRAARENPEDGTAQFNQGISLLKEGRNEEAEAAFERAAAADPPMSEAHYYLGTLLINQGKAAEAREHLEAYVASEPANAQNLATARGLLEALEPQ